MNNIQLYSNYAVLRQKQLDFQKQLYHTEQDSKDV